jgi:nucleoside-diphosphate-sugar epimerase
MFLTTNETIERDESALVHLEQTKIERILIVGGSGFVASALINYLHRIAKSTTRTLKTIVLSRSRHPNEIFSSDFKFYSHPKEEDLRRFYEESMPDAVIFVSRIENAAKNKNVVSENLKFLNSHLETITELNPAPRLVFLSSGAVYGQRSIELEHIPFKEELETKTSSLSDYAKVKIESERLIHSYFAETNSRVVVARLFAFFGPGLPLEKFAIGEFMLSKIQEKSIEIRGTGGTIRSYMYVDDLSATLIRLAAVGSGIVNVGGDNSLRIIELAEKFRELFGCSIKVLNKEVPETYYVPDLSKLDRNLGRVNYISLDDGLRFWSKYLRDKSV